jgi:arabinan endo-1,5-alpha-L-arabinosidase
MVKNSELQIRDPYVIPVSAEGKYYLFGSTDKNIWGPGTGFDAYVGVDLEQWEGPFPVFRPGDDFYSDRNFWAPEVYAYRGRYYMFATFRRKDNGLLGTAVLVSDGLLGPFEPHSDGPVTPLEWTSLDGTLHIDEQDQPWMVFCHEWQQVGDGQVCAVRMSEDLKRAVGEPTVLFRASEAPWTTPYVSEKYGDQVNYVTDGPYMFRTSDGRLLMMWASFIDNRYALGVASSSGGKVTGPWTHEEQALFRNDGGHGMVFRTFEGELVLTVHTPNKTPHERPIFLNVVERDGKLEVLGERD